MVTFDKKVFHMYLNPPKMWSYVCLLAFLASVYGEQDVVAFTKGLVAHAHLTKGEVVSYNKDITNINAMFTSDSKFQVQIPGIYSFHFYSLSRSDSEIWLNFFKNEEYLVSIYAYTASDWADAGNTVILELQQGDLVYVKAVDDYDNSLYGAENEIYTTFSGELLFSEKSGTSSPIALSVGLTHNVTLPDSGAVIYDKIMTNAGNGYDTTTGDFVAPQDGSYIIHYHSLSELGEEMWLDLYLNDQYINSAYGQAPHTWADAGNSAVLDLHQGDKLRIKARPTETVILYGGTDEVYCTLSITKLINAHGSSSSGSAASGVQAFSVGLSKNLDNGVTNHKAVFDKVFTNHGGVYNASTGVFTAKVAGLYVFHYHGLAQQDEEVWLELFHNFIYINSLYGHAAHGWAGGSNTATVQMAVGDTVYVDMKDHSTKMYGAADEVYCTFTGYLLAPMNANLVVG